MDTDFREVIWERLEYRDKHAHAFNDTIETNKRLLQRLIDQQRINAQLEMTRGSLANNERVQDLDRRIRELQEERAEMYKTQSANAQRLVELNEQLRLKEELKEDLKKRVKEVKTLASRCDLQVQQLREKDVTIQVLQDELSALQLEITTTEERSKKLEKENAQLLQRWLDKMNAEAEKMNEAAEFYENFLEQARMAGRTVTKSDGRWVMGPPVANDAAVFVSTVLLPTRAPRKLMDHESDIHCIQASKTGAFFATGGADKKIKIYDDHTGKVSKTLGGALQTIMSIDFSTNDTALIAASADNTSRIWDLETGRIKHTLTGHIGNVYAARFNMDTTKAMSGSHDRTLKVWDLQKGYCVRTIFTFSSCNDLCLMDADGQTLVSGHLDNSVRMWDTRTGNGIKELSSLHTGQVTSVSMSRDGHLLLTNSRDNTLKLTDIRTYEVVDTFQAESYRTRLNWARVCFSPDDHYIAGGSADGELHIWDVRSKALKLRKKEHSASICGVSWNPLGTHLYSADDKRRTVCVWDTSISK